MTSGGDGVTDLTRDGGYDELEFPKSRIAVVDLVKEGMKKHHIPALLELDVTDA